MGKLLLNSATSLVFLVMTDDSKSFMINDSRLYFGGRNGHVIPEFLKKRAQCDLHYFVEYYPNCKIQFMGLANIHSIRKSFQSLQELCCRQEEQTG